VTNTVGPFLKEKLGLRADESARVQSLSCDSRLRLVPGQQT
jgi:hypothetical protein